MGRPNTYPMIEKPDIDGQPDAILLSGDRPVAVGKPDDQDPPRTSL